MNGYGRFAPKSANAGSRGARRVFGRPASAFDEPLVATVEAAPEAVDASAGPGLAKASPR